MAKKIKRKSGPKKAHGETKNDIVSILLKLEREKPELNENAMAFQSIPDFMIKEPELIEIIRKELDIYDKKGISGHLEKLCKDGVLIKYAKDNKDNFIRLSEQGKILKKNSTGSENIWQIDPVAFKKIAKMFLGKKDELLFLQSNYAQKWIKENAFPEFIENFGINLNAIQEIIDSFKNNMELDYLEILRNKVTQTSSHSPLALKFILETKIDNFDARINSLMVLNENSFVIEKLFGIQIKKDLFFEKYGADNTFNSFQKIISNSPGWAMLNYCEFSIKVLENDLIKDFFRYPDFFLERTKPLTNALGGYLLETMIKAASLLRSQQKPDIVAERIIQTVVNEMERKANKS